MRLDTTDNKGNPTGKQWTLISTFDLYNKEVSDGTEIKRIATFVYEIRTWPDNTTIHNNLLCKISSDPSIGNEFIPYRLNTLTKKETMHESVIQ